MKRVLYAGGFILPNKNAAAHRVVSISKGLEKLGCQVDFLQGREIVGLDRLKKDGWTNHSRSKFSLRKIIGLDVVAASIKCQSEIIILYNYWSFPFAVVLIFSFFTRKKVIADCTEWYGTDGFFGIKKLVKWLDTEIRMRILNRLSHRVISISKYLHSFYGKKSVLIPPTVDISDEKWKKVPTSHRSLDKFKFLYSGNVGNSKDRLDFLLREIVNQKLEDICEVIIAGTSREDFLNAHDPRELPNDYTECLRFAGKLSHEDLISLQKESHALFFIRPNTRANRAGFPTKFVEAYTIGLPIITNSMSDVADFFLDQEVGLLVDDFQFLDIEMITRLYQHHKKPLRNTFDYNQYLSELEQVLD